MTREEFESAHELYDLICDVETAIERLKTPGAELEVSVFAHGERRSLPFDLEEMIKAYSAKLDDMWGTMLNVYGVLRNPVAIPPYEDKGITPDNNVGTVATWPPLMNTKLSDAELASLKECVRDPRS